METRLGKKKLLKSLISLDKINSVRSNLETDEELFGFLGVKEERKVRYLLWALSKH